MSSRSERQGLPCFWDVESAECADLPEAAPMLLVMGCCLFGAVVSARFANKCENRRLNRIVGVVLMILGIVTIAIKII